MIPVSREEASLLLSDWKEREVWLGVTAFLRTDAKEEHKFWGRVAEVSSERVTLAGQYGLIEIPFEPEAVLEYSEVSEAPEAIRERFSGYEFCLTIRSQSVLAFLFGEKPKKE